MSQHHRSSKHTSRAPSVRAQVAATLPRRCTDCPHVVDTTMRWQLGHRVPAWRGGQTTFENCGPAHAYCPWCKRACNQVAGGRMGAAVTNARRGAVTRRDRGLRRW